MWVGCEHFFFVSQWYVVMNLYDAILVYIEWQHKQWNMFLMYLPHRAAAHGHCGIYAVPLSHTHRFKI